MSADDWSIDVKHERKEENEKNVVRYFIVNMSSNIQVLSKTHTHTQNGQFRYFDRWLIRTLLFFYYSYIIIMRISIWFFLSIFLS